MAKIEADITLLDNIRQFISSGFDRVRPTRKCPELSDEEFVLYGIVRVLTHLESGRGYLQWVRDKMGCELPRQTFFSAMHSPRRKEAVLKCLQGMRKVADHSCQGKDHLKDFPELNGWEVCACDGHVVAHASHAGKDCKGRNVPSRNIYRQDLRTGYCSLSTHVEGGSQHHHEIPAFRKTVNPKDSHLIYVLDRAFIDNTFWTLMKRNDGPRFICRMKSNMRPIFKQPLPFDRNDPLNNGVTGFYRIGFNNTWTTLLMVEYTDPETGTSFQFFSSFECDRPGLIAWLYMRRWNLEKAFDTFKNKLHEKKEWCGGENASVVRGAFICMAYNFLRQMEYSLETDYNIKNEKTSRKYAACLDKRREKARKKGRSIHPFIGKTGLRLHQMSQQFVRTVRNLLLDSRPFSALLSSFRHALVAYN